MSTSLTKVNTGLSGDREAIVATVERLKAMTNIPTDAPTEAVWGLAQMCVALDLNPLTGEAYLAKFNGKYGPIVGTMGYEKEARQQSEYHYDIRPLDEQELKTHRGGMYHPEDYGVEITLWNYAKAGKCKQLGIPYSPAKSYGFWRKKAQEIVEWKNKQRVGTGEYREDNVPETWSKVMVAEKRAIRTVLKRDFSFRSFEKRMSDLGGIEADEFEASVYNVVEEALDKEEKRTSPIVEQEFEEDSNGLIVATRVRPRDPVPFTLNDVEEIEGGEPDVAHPDDEDPMNYYYFIIHDENTPDEWFNLMRVLHDGRGEPCAPKEYGKLVGRLIQLGITNEYRPFALAILFGRTVNKDNRPPYVESKSLYEWLGPDTSPDYSEDAHDMITALPGIIDSIELATGCGPNTEAIPY